MEPEAQNGSHAPAAADAAKPVNPLRLARPLEKSAGLSRTTIPPTRPMPLPTVSPLCPPGSKQTANNNTAAAAKQLQQPKQTGNSSDNNHVTSSEPADAPIPAAVTSTTEAVATTAAVGPVTAVTTVAAEGSAPAAPLTTTAPAPTAVESSDSTTTNGGSSTPVELPPVSQPLPPSANAAKLQPVAAAVTAAAFCETPLTDFKSAEAGKPEEAPMEKASDAAPPAVEKKEEAKKSADTSAKPDTAVAPADTKAKTTKAAAEEDLENDLPPARPIIPKPATLPPKKAMSPLPPKKQTTAAAAAAAAIAESAEKNAVAAQKEAAVAPAAKPVVEATKPTPVRREPVKPKIPVAEKTPRQKGRQVAKKPVEAVPATPEDDKRSSKRSRVPPAVYTAEDPEMEQIIKSIKKQEEEERKTQMEKKAVGGGGSGDTGRSRGRKRAAPEPAAESEARGGKKKADPVFFKDEYLAVRNPDDGFYICKAMQNIFIGSRKIRIQWLSNESHIIPAKDNPDGDIYAPDFYDKTDFETIITSVEMDRVLGKSKRMILPEEELERIKKILERARAKAEGRLDLSGLLTEDNPDGLDISLYKGEEQLDKIEKKRKEDEKKTTKKNNNKKDDTGPLLTDDDDDPTTKAEPDTKKESKPATKKPKKVVPLPKTSGRSAKPAVSAAATDESANISSRAKRKSAEKAKDALGAFDFEDSDDEEEEAEKEKEGKGKGKKTKLTSPTSRKRKSIEALPSAAAKKPAPEATESVATAAKADSVPADKPADGKQEEPETAAEEKAPAASTLTAAEEKAPAASTLSAAEGDKNGTADKDTPVTDKVQKVSEEQSSSESTIVEEKTKQPDATDSLKKRGRASAKAKQ